jgi:ubiquinone/menaquinone biosynthesis C-methylase UbiE
VQKHDTVLDIGCGGGRTLSKLAAIVSQGRVYGVDHSKDAVAVASRINRKWIDVGRVEIQEGSVSQLPFPQDMFDLVTAVETHFWWPDLPGDMSEVFRVLKRGGMLIVIAEVYGGAQTKIAKMVEKYLPLSGMKLLSVDEHRELLANAGFSDVQVVVEPGNGWICGIGRKPSTT